MTQGSYGNDLGMTWEYLGDSGRVWNMTVVNNQVQIRLSGEGFENWYEYDGYK